MVANLATPYGLTPWTDLMASYGYPSTQTINSSYRTPSYNQTVIKSVAGSRHQFGDAIDISNVTRSQLEHDAKACLAGVVAATHFAQNVTSCAALGITEDAGADYVEPNNSLFACKLGCVHADWRNHAYDFYIP